MYRRHSASFIGSAETLSQQQPSPFQQRARSVGGGGATTPDQLQASFRSDQHRPTTMASAERRPSSQQISPNNISDTLSSSMSEVDENYYSNGNRDHDDKYHKRSNNSSKIHIQAFFFWRVLPCLAIMALPWIPCHSVRRRVQSKNVAIETVIREQKDLVADLDETTAKM